MSTGQDRAWTIAAEWLLPACVAALLAAGGCSWGSDRSGDHGQGGGQESRGARTTGPPSRTPAPTPRPTSNAQVLALLEATNQADIHRGQVAQGRAENEAVRRFAERLKRDHQELLDMGHEVAARLQVTPRLGPQGTQLLRQQTDEMAELQAATAPTFDRQFLEHEVRVHEQLLQGLKEAAKRVDQRDVQELVKRSQARVQEHLQAARELQRETGRRAGRPGPAEGGTTGKEKTR